MLMNKAIATAVLAALAEQASAANVHRHLHHQVQKRALETEWVTVYETTYVTAGQEPAPTEGSNAEGVNAQGAGQEHVKNPPPAAKPTTTSTTSIVVPSTQPVVPAEASQPPPAPEPTTLATSVKPAAAKPSTEARPESQPEPKPSLPLDIGVSLSIPGPEEPTPTTTTENPKPTTDPNPPSGGSPFSGKRGLAYNDGTLANLFGNSCKTCGWGYNWGSTRSGLDDKYSFVPMLWGDKPEFTESWESNCEDAISSGSKAVFSFNEPDHAAQANMSPSQAAAAHAKYMNKYKGRVQIGAPAVTNSGSTDQGLDWLKKFMSACDAQEDSCAIDFCNVHWYSEAQYADTLFEHLEQAHKICDGKPVWLTEFAPLGSDDQISDFMKTNIPKLDKVEYLDAYSYFMVSTGKLLSSLDALSGYGELYATVA